MPLIIDRRSFLKGTAGGLLAFSLNRGLLADDEVARVALLSDTHIAADPNDRFRGFSPHENLRKTVIQAGDQEFDLVLVNGDLARLQGTPEDYVQFKALIDPLLESAPMVVTMGNHDDRKNAESALVKRAGELEPVQKKLVSTIDAGAFKLIMLDSLLATNVTPGQLGKAQRQWLADYIESQGTRPLLVFVHHQPDPNDDGALVDAERLLAILKPHRSVKALLFGHTHVWALDKQDDMHLINLPAVGYNFSDGHPVGWVDASFSSQGADLKLHALAGETRDDGKSFHLVWR